jgi:hypothetical protein
MRRQSGERQGPGVHGTEAELAKHIGVIAADGARSAHGLPRVRSPLAQSADTWLRRGYQLQYHDEHLAQLTAPASALTGHEVALAVGVGALAGVGAALGLFAYLALARRGRHHVVSLLLTPERRIITHRQWQPMPIKG